MCDYEDYEPMSREDEEFYYDDIDDDYYREMEYDDYYDGLEPEEIEEWKR